MKRKGTREAVHGTPVPPSERGKSSVESNSIFCCLQIPGKFAEVECHHYTSQVQPLHPGTFEDPDGRYLLRGHRKLRLALVTVAELRVLDVSAFFIF
jgi:hypothetical protein